jgi:hypothetical protein
VLAGEVPHVLEYATVTTPDEKEGITLMVFVVELPVQPPGRLQT